MPAAVVAGHYENFNALKTNWNKTVKTPDFFKECKLL